MASDNPVNLNFLESLFEKDAEKPDRSVIRECLDRLGEDYTGRAVELRELASGFRFQVREEYAEWVNRIFEERPQRYTRALLETLAIIAYRQPITRNEIEDIRGVSVSSNIVKPLQERGWVRIVGHRDVPGKPELLATTREFLDYFNLRKLSDLPSLEAIKDYDQINPDLFESLQSGQPALPVSQPGEQSPADDQAGDSGHTVQISVAAASRDGENRLLPEAGFADPDQDTQERTDGGKVIPFSG